MHQVVAVLPVYNPNDPFEFELEELLHVSFAQIIIVNDGSSAVYSAVFERLQKKPNIIVLTHEQKLGKTEAVKTAASYVQRYLKRCKGILLIGAYGQHKVKDVNKCFTSPAFITMASSLVCAASVRASYRRLVDLATYASRFRLN